MLRAAGPDNAIASAETSAGIRGHGRVRVLGIRHALAAFLAVWPCLLLVLYTEGNGFPALWHWDEPSKVAQLSGEAPNFHHPRLLLDATEAVLALENNPSPLDIVVAGRVVSAISAVATVVLLTLLTLRLYGEMASLLVAVFAGMNPLLYGLAHYMKEDTVFVLGLCLFLLAFVRYSRSQDRWGLLQLGLAAGIATSAKYLGAAMIPLALAVVIWRGRAQHEGAKATAIRAGLVAALAATVFLALDWPLFTQFHLFESGLRGSTRQVAVGDFGGLHRSILSGFYFRGLIDLCPPIAIAAFGCYVVHALRSKSRSRAIELVVALSPIIFILLLHLSPAKRIRYELPAILLMLMAAAVFIAEMARRGKRLELRIVALLAIAAILGEEGMSLSASRAAILNDSRAEMASWIRAHLPQTSVMAGSRVDGLSENRSPTPAPGDVPVKLIEAMPNYGDLEGLRAMGVTHVLVTQLVLNQYFNRSFVLDAKDTYEAGQVALYRAFFRELFANGVLVHHVDGATPAGTYVSPELWLFDIRRDAVPANRPARPLEPPVSNSLLD